MVHRQPALHALDLCVRAPTVVVSDHSGQIGPGDGHGVLHADIRVLSRAELSMDGSALTPVATVPDGPGRSRFVLLARDLGDAGPDPTVRVERHRQATVDGLVERIVIGSTAREPVRTTVRLAVAADLVAMALVWSGADGDPVRPRDVPGGLAWVRDGRTVTVTGANAELDGSGLSWSIEVKPHTDVELTWRLHVTDPTAVVVGAAEPVEWARPGVAAADPRLAALVDRSLDDLAALRLATRDQPGETFLAAGAPWFCTLFGRDSLWAARLLLPLGTELAGSTLRVLAARQGTRSDAETAEAPGKILHELRRDGLLFPAEYYGSIDATPLWVCLLHDAWRWGLPVEQVDALLPHAEAALAWLADDADPDGDGFLEYRDASGHGLANQGWKDSGDAIRFPDGRTATPPIALCEVQGYAYEAATKGAVLLAAFGRPGAERWLDYAGGLAERFRARFWVTDDIGPYPAIALDADKRPVDVPTSNIGHLVGSGMLTDTEIATIADRVVRPDMTSGYGLRTMSSAAGPYAPLSYHCGSVWPHDTVIVAQALAAAGHPAAAAELVLGLLRAAPAFGYRLPELYGGDADTDLPRPTAYPPACRPQAWSAAAGIGLISVLTGLCPDVPGGVLRVAPPRPCPVGALTVRGLRLAGEPLDVTVAADGTTVTVRGPSAVAVDLAE